VLRVCQFVPGPPLEPTAPIAAQPFRSAPGEILASFDDRRDDLEDRCTDVDHRAPRRDDCVADLDRRGDDSSDCGAHSNPVDAGIHPVRPGSNDRRGHRSQGRIVRSPVEPHGDDRVDQEDTRHSHSSPCRRHEDARHSRSWPSGADEDASRHASKERRSHEYRRRDHSNWRHTGMDERGADEDRWGAARNTSDTGKDRREHRRCPRRRGDRFRFRRWRNRTWKRSTSLKVAEHLRAPRGPREAGRQG
jgi:hypothetical protein